MFWKNHIFIKLQRTRRKKYILKTITNMRRKDTVTNRGKTEKSNNSLAQVGQHLQGEVLHCKLVLGCFCCFRCVTFAPFKLLWSVCSVTVIGTHMEVCLHRPSGKNGIPANKSLHVNPCKKNSMRHRISYNLANFCARDSGFRMEFCNSSNKIL